MSAVNPGCVRQAQIQMNKESRAIIGRHYNLRTKRFRFQPSIRRDLVDRWKEPLRFLGVYIG